jgi:hypothetical protein
VESFEPAVHGNPAQWMHARPTTEEISTDCCPANLYAPTYPYESCGCVDL